MTDRIVIECKTPGCSNHTHCQIILFDEATLFTGKIEFTCPWDGEQSVGEMISHQKLE